MTARTKASDYETAIERSLRAFQERSDSLRREREDAPKRLARLSGLSPDQHNLLLRNSLKFPTWGLFEALVQGGREKSLTDPSRAEELLQLALRVSMHLDSSFYGRERIEDLRARTWGYIANARRIKLDFQGAEDAFGEAFLRLAVGTSDPMEKALLYDLKASLLRFQQNFDESVQLSRKAIGIFRRMGESQRVGHCLINLSAAHRFMGNTDEAISLLHQSLDLVDRDREPRLTLCALNNLGEYLAHAGRLMEAQQILTRARPLYQRFPEPKLQTYRHWVEAKVAAGLGHIERANDLLQRAKAGVFETGMEMDRSFILRDETSLKARGAGVPA